ncbi:MAG: PqqD family protein [Sulfuricurvum sp.]|nr:PqqD family protein [Sulfuricurvum sp.]
MNLESRYTIPSTVLLQCIDDETLLFNSSNELFFALNEMGAVMWEMMSKSHSLQEIFDEMVELFEVDNSVLSNDIIAFANTLAEQGLLSFETKV